MVKPKHLYCRRTKEKGKDKLLKYSKTDIVRKAIPGPQKDG